MEDKKVSWEHYDRFDTELNQLHNAIKACEHNRSAEVRNLLAQNGGEKILTRENGQVYTIMHRTDTDTYYLREGRAGRPRKEPVLPKEK